MLLNEAYYAFKFFVPRRLQINLRRLFVRRKLPKCAGIWPINRNAGKPPEKWSCWPDGKKFALVLTHDVETAKSLGKCYQLAKIEERLGFRSSFNFVPGDYPIPETLRQYLIDHGFETAIHGLHHNNNPFRSESIFRKQAEEINHYLKVMGSVGFRSPSMYHDLELLHHLDIEYDASTFDTDPFEPQPDGMGTIFPFWVPNRDPRKGYVELPYTLPQDFLLYILLQEKNVNIWKKKLDWIADHGGMAMFISHPDYMNFNGVSQYDEYPAKYYEEFLEYIKVKYGGRYWNALPKVISRFWAGRYKASPTPSPVVPLSSPRHEGSTVSKVTIVDPMNDPRWDQFVEGHPFGLICHLAGWKQVLEKSFSHMKGHYLALLNRDNDSIRAALPIFEIRSIFTGNRLVSIPFATICDPLISSNEDMRELLDAAINLSKKLGCSKLEIRTLASSSLIDDSRICNVVHHKCHQLSLETGPDEIIKTYRRQFRQHINKSAKSGLDLQTAKDETELNEFYHLYVRNRKSLGLPPQPHLFFKLLWRTFLSSKHITLLMVRREGELVAGLMMFKFKDRCSCEYMALEESSKNLNTRHFIFWEAIKAAYSEGFKMFDFGRTGIHNEGLMIYKSHWGTEAVDLPQFYYPKEVCSRLIPADISITYTLIRKITKKIPDSLFQSMGNFIYQHLG